MTEEIAADVLNNSLYGDLYGRGKDPKCHKYRMGNLKIDSTPISWETFNLTKNYRETINILQLDKMLKISKSNLSDEEKKNLEKLLKQPKE